MEGNDILRRRQTPVSSGFRQGLLQNDHLGYDYDYNSNSNSNGGGSGSSYPYNQQQQHQQHRQRQIQQQPIIVHSTYAPPESFVDNDSGGAKWQQSKSQQRQLQLQQQQLLYLNPPRAGSFKRAIQSQTPSRTSSYNSYNNNNSNCNKYNNNNNNNKINLSTSTLRPIPHDLAHNSFFSYGCCCIQCVRTKEVGIMENFGRFEKLLPPGVHCIPWPLVDITGRLSLRINQLEVSCETKTSDSVFITISITLQYRIIVERSYDAYYRLSDPRTQISSYVYDVVRSTVPKMTCDDIYCNKSTIAKQVKVVLSKVLSDYGYEILDALTTDIRPAEDVVRSMNEINASKRMKVAMVYKAEADKIQKVKDAEAHCESLYLQGIGIAGQRSALLKELKESFRKYMEEEGSNQRDVMTLLFMTQYMDTIAAVSQEQGEQQSLLLEGNDRGNLFTLTDQLQIFENKEGKDGSI